MTTTIEEELSEIDDEMVAILEDAEMNHNGFMTQKAMSCYNRLDEKYDQLKASTEVTNDAGVEFETITVEMLEFRRGNKIVPSGFNN